MRRAGFVCLLVLLGRLAFAANDSSNALKLSGAELPIVLENDAEAKISVSSCFSSLPSSGYAPISINIDNDSARARSWTFQFRSPAYSYIPADSMAFAVDLKVQSKSARTFKILVPLAFRGTEYYYSPLGVTVIGPGASGKSTQQFPVGNRTGKTPTAFVAISAKLSSQSWSQVQKELADKKDDLIGTSFEANELPDDWRGLAGISGIWITQGELATMSAGQRAALHDWMCRGGSLFVCGADEVDNQFRSSGFGRVLAIPGGALVISNAASEIHNLKGQSLEEQLNNAYSNNLWTAVGAVGPIKLNAPLLVGFMTLFAVVAGPVNLFWLAGRLRRQKLFWTTPLISLAASILLLVLIIFQDGFGGSGSRIALVHISPVEKRQVLLQEQISRTGVLLSSSFGTREPCFIAPIASDGRRQPLRNSSKHSYENSETHFRGEWFLSRTLQGHWVESIAPRRADVVLANAAELRHSRVAPIVVSNIDGELEHIYYRDQIGQAWGGHNVRTGQRVTLTKEADIPDLLPAEAGPRLRTLWERVDGQKSYFYATSRSSKALIETLPSVRWKNDLVIFLGPLSIPAPQS